MTSLFDKAIFFYVLVNPKFRVNRSTFLVIEVKLHVLTIPPDVALFTVMMNLIFHQ